MGFLYEIRNTHERNLLDLIIGFVQNNFGILYEVFSICT